MAPLTKRSSSGVRAVTVQSGKSFQWLTRTIPSVPSVALDLSKLSGASVFFVCEDGISLERLSVTAWPFRISWSMAGLAVFEGRL